MRKYRGFVVKYCIGSEEDVSKRISKHHSSKL
nr:MAG TPA: hypothetical protein [Caudoviricetes sp.]